jgi:hypothetical protein
MSDTTSDQFKQSEPIKKPNGASVQADKDWTPTGLAIALTVGLFGLVFFMMLHELPPGAKEPVNLMLGSIATAWVAMVSYYFGSSSGSQSKDRLLLEAAPPTAKGDGK